VGVESVDGIIYYILLGLPELSRPYMFLIMDMKLRFIQRD